MAIQKIITVPNEILRQKSKPVTKIDKKVLETIKDMQDTLVSQKNPTGVGLSAPQVGKSCQICLVVSRKDKKTLALINPEITWKSKTPTNHTAQTEPEDSKRDPLEGCLSVPGFWGTVQRAKEIKVSYLTPENKEIKQKFSGFTAVVIQHEVDHLNGVLFIDRILEQKGKIYRIEENDKGEEEFIEVELV